MNSALNHNRYNGRIVVAIYVQAGALHLTAKEIAVVLQLLELLLSQSIGVRVHNVAEAGQHLLADNRRHCLVTIFFCLLW